MHSHSPSPVPPQPHALPDAHARLEAFLMFLRTQFGDDAVTLLSSTPSAADDSDSGIDEGEDDTQKSGRRRRAEQERLHRLGVPVAGVAVRVDNKLEARVWLEDLEVECANRVFADRVRAVVERACEVTAPLWG